MPAVSPAVPTTGSAISTSGCLDRPTRRVLYAALIALAAAQATAQLFQSGPRFTAGRWPETRPADVPFFSANDRSRWCAVWSLAERHTHQIDEIITRPGWDTIDKVRLGEHFYSSKPPFVAALATVVYRGVKLGLGYDLDRTPHEAAHAVLWCLNVVPWIAALVVLALLIERHGTTDFSRLTAVVTATLATFVTPFLQTLNNHTPAVCALVFSIAAVLWARRSPDRWRPFALAGFWGAVTACCELPAAVWGLAAFGLCLRANLRSTLCLFLPAALPPLALFLWTNWEVTGGLLPAYASFGSAGSNPYHYIVGGIPSYWLNPSAIDRGESSGGWYLFHCVLGHHGIFSLSPIFLLTLAGWFWWPQPASPIAAGSGRGPAEPETRDPLDREERFRFASPSGPENRLLTQLGLGLTVWVLIFYLGQTKSWNYGGVSCCLRWALWLVPAWVLGLLAPLDRWGRWPAVRWLTAGLLGLSFYSASIPRENPWQLPWLQTLWQQWYPIPGEGPTLPPSPTWMVRLPRWPAGVNNVVATYSAELPGGEKEEFTLTFPRPTEGRQATVQVTGAAPGVAGRWLEGETLLEVDLSALAEAPPDPGKGGEPIATAPGPSAGPSRTGDPTARPDPSPGERFLRGLPLVGSNPVQYRWGSTRYLKTVLQRDALPCRLLSASVLLPAEANRGSVRSRRVVWWSEELPWGVVQIEDTLADAVDNTLLARRRYRLVSLSPPLLSAQKSSPNQAEGSSPSSDR